MDIGNELLVGCGDAADKDNNDTGDAIDEQNINQASRSEVHDSEPNILPRRSAREKKTTVKFSGCVTNFVGKTEDEDPITVKDAMNSTNSEDWKKAMSSEYDSLIDNKTWTLVKLPGDRKTVNNKWVFKTKCGQNGEVLRYKARLVAKGCSQLYGIDYEETYAPVVRYTSIRILMAIAARENLEIEQMDAVTAFLQGDIEEELYMKQPECFDDGSGRVCRLNKAIYGLKQASRQWNIKLNKALIDSGFSRSSLDPCVYAQRNGKFLVYVAVYVDDLLIFSNNVSMKNKLKNSLSYHFKMKDLGEAKSCIGIHITRNRQDGKIYLDQTKYIDCILDKFGMNECNPIKTPTDVNQRLTKEMAFNSEGELHDMSGVPYQEVVGSILYLAQCTRPDIAFAVGMVSKFNNQHGPAHWTAVKRILKYLKGTREFKMEFSAAGNREVIGFSDADWGADVDDRKSCTGYVFTMQGGAISWLSKKQQTVALSSTEAEYMAVSTKCQEANWLRKFTAELSGTTLETIDIFCDNRSALNLANTDAYHARTKHIDIRHHFIRDKVNNKEVAIQPINTVEMIADNLTKGVTSEKHTYCTKGMGIIQL